MLSLLASFDFFSSGTVLAECPAEQLLKDVLVPVWNSRLDILKVFNKYLVDLQSAVECLCGLADGVVLD